MKGRVGLRRRVSSLLIVSLLFSFNSFSSYATDGNIVSENSNAVMDACEEIEENTGNVTSDENDGEVDEVLLEDENASGVENDISVSENTDYSVSSNFIPGEVVKSGKTGELTWQLTAINQTDLELSISGNGNMPNYSYSQYNNKVYTPWEYYTASIKKVYIQSGITSIGDYAFYGCDSLTEVDIPYGVNDIGVEAFKNCKSLANIELPDSIENISRDAFYLCIRLANIELPDSIENISSHAFYDTAITNIVLPASLDRLGDYAFSSCNQLESVVFQHSLSYLGKGVFSGCKKLKKVNLPEWNGEYNDVTPGTLFQHLFNQCQELESICIPESFPEISEGMFASCYRLDNVEIPDSITLISHKAFMGCRSLSEVVLPKNIQTIGTGAFNLTTETHFTPSDVRLPKQYSIIYEGDNNISLGTECFKFDENDSIRVYADVSCLLKYKWGIEDCQLIPYSWYEEYEYVIDEEDGEIILTKYKSEKTIANLFSVIWKNKKKYHTVLEGGVFSDNSDLQETNIEDGVIVRDGACLFRKCTSLTKVRLPGEINKIYEYMFEGCIKLKDIDWDDQIKEIERYAFYKCSSLSLSKLPESVSVIGNVAFYNCSQIAIDVIPNNVESIGEQAFYNCDRIKSIMYYGDRLNYIGEKAFYCSRYVDTTLITDNDILCNYDWADSNRGVSIIKSKWIEKYDYEIEDSYVVLKKYTGDVKEVVVKPRVNINGTMYQVRIDADAFRDNELIEYVDIESGVSIASLSYLFAGCEKLREVIISDDLSSVDEHMFDGCINLNRFVLSSGISTIKPYAFRNCLSLRLLYLPNKLKSIGEGAFEGCAYMETVMLPSSLETIESKAFYDCSSLKTITCFGDTLTKIGDKAFYVEKQMDTDIQSNNYAMKSYDWLKDKRKTNFVDLNWYKSFEIYVYDNTMMLTKYTGKGASISIEPKALYRGKEYNVTLGGNLFMSNALLENVTIKDGVSIDEESPELCQNMFADCAMLKNVVLPYGVKRIECQMFALCSSLKGINIPETVTFIAQESFYSCSSLEAVKIPSGIIQIGNYAFAKCNKLSKIEYYGNELKQLGEHVFAVDNKSPLLTTLLTDNSILENYPWKDDNRIFEVINIDSLSFNKANIIIPVGEDEQLVCIVSPEDATDSITWNCSDSTIISVSVNDIEVSIHAEAVGCAMITAETPNGISANCLVEVVPRDIEVEHIVLSENNISLEIGSKYSITATIEPEISSSCNLVWTSEDESVASIVGDGNVAEVTAKAIGETTIKVAADNGIYAECVVTVVEKKGEIESITLSKSSLSVKEGESVILSATVKPENSLSCNLVWTSEDESVASIVGDGNVAEITAKAIGKTTIKVTADNGIYAKCVVTVVEKKGEIESITLSKSRLNVKEGESVVLSATVKPDNASAESLNWVSEDETIAEIIDNGGTATVKGISKGSTKIKAVASNDIYAVCVVTVSGRSDLSAMDTQPDITEETENLTLVVGQKFVLDGGGWESNSPSYLSVSKKGVVKAKKAYPNLLLIQRANGTVRTIKVAVVKPGIPKDNSIYVGSSYIIPLSVTGDLPVTWVSSDPYVASVSPDGEVYGISNGKTTITAYINGVAFNCRITVKAANTNGKDFTSTVDLVPMQSVAIKASGFKAANATWTSDLPALPASHLGKNVVFENAVVRITKSGKITAIGEGTTQIKGVNGGASISFTVVVSAPITQIVHLNYNSSKTIKLYGTKGVINWKADNNNVVINKNRITGYLAGSTTLTADYENFCYKIIVYVEIPTLTTSKVSGSFPKYSLNMKVGDTVELQEKQMYQNVLYRSNKNDIAFVDEEGVITARKAGKATITAKVNGKKVTITVNVTN